jgi:hypothetical protein
MKLRIVSTIDRFGKQCVVVPVLLLGIALTEISERLIRFGAWLSDYQDGDQG